MGFLRDDYVECYTRNTQKHYCKQQRQVRSTIVRISPTYDKGEGLVFQYKSGKGCILLLSVAMPKGKPPCQFEQTTGCNGDKKNKFSSSGLLFLGSMK